MRKVVVGAALGIAGAVLAPTAAVAGECEIRHTVSIAACDGDSACSDQADLEYMECLRRQVVIYE